MSGQQILKINAPRQVEDQSIGLYLCLCLATCCLHGTRRGWAGLPNRDERDG
jgi:hypothetical protein